MRRRRLKSKRSAENKGGHTFKDTAEESKGIDGTVEKR